MPLYVNDDGVDALARTLQRMTCAKTKTAAVRQALTNEIDRVNRQPPLRERLAVLKEKARRVGGRDPTFDQKRFTDEMWGDL